MQLSNIIQVGKLLDRPEFSSYIITLGRPIVSEIIRTTIDHYKNQIMEAQRAVDLDELTSQIAQQLQQVMREKTQPVINGTGILVHTNLGRSPINQTSWDQAGETVWR